MNLDVLTGLNWFAVAIATLAYYLFGAVWFAQRTLGGLWNRAGGDPIAAGRFSPLALYVVPLVTCLVTSVAVAALAAGTGSNSVGEGLVLGLVTSSGVAAVLFVTGFFDRHKPAPGTWFAITTGYHVVGIVIAAVVVSLWD